MASFPPEKATFCFLEKGDWVCLRSHTSGPLNVSPTAHEGISFISGGLGKFRVSSQGIWAKSLGLGFGGYDFETHMKFLQKKKISHRYQSCRMSQEVSKRS